MDDAVRIGRARKSAWRPLRMLGDGALARAAADGDRLALGAIFERHHQALYRYCRALLGNDADAQDALQNTMTRVVRALPGERRDIALKPWLYRIAHNEAVRLLGSRRLHAPLDDARELPAPDGADRDAARARLAGLMGDLGELPERQRAAVVLRELNGLAFEDIGAALGMSAAAAKQSVYEARVSLQEFEQGRAMRCEDVQRAVSDGDRRKLRGRRMRAHLGDCGGCAAFRAGIEHRAGELRALAPPLAAPAAAAILAETVAGGGSVGGGGLLALLGGAAKAVAPAAALKAAGTVAVVVTAGAAVAATEQGDRSRTAAEVPAPLVSPEAARSGTAAGPFRPAQSGKPGTAHERTDRRASPRDPGARRAGRAPDAGERTSSSAPATSPPAPRRGAQTPVAGGDGDPQPRGRARAPEVADPPASRPGREPTAPAPARERSPGPDAPAPPVTPTPTPQPLDPAPPSAPAPSVPVPEAGGVQPAPATGQAQPLPPPEAGRSSGRLSRSSR